MSKFAQKKGFSLVELLVYLASMTVILLALSYVMFNVYNLYLSLVSNSRADRTASTLMQVLSTEIRSGATIDQSNSVFNAPIGRLSISTYSNMNLVEKDFYVADNRIVMDVDGTKTEMTPEDIDVSKFLFNQILTPVSYAVRYEFDLTYSVRGELVTKTYPGLVVLRRSYD